MDVDGRVAVVTGAAVGIGQAVAVRLAERGARLVLADIADCEETLGLIGGGEAVAMEADLCDDRQAERLVETARSRFGGLDILVNNAGGGQPAARFPDATVAQWSAVLQLNLRAPMLLTQLALPALAAAGGAVVNVASSAGRGEAPYEWPEYATAKAGLIRFTTAMGGRPDGVRVNCIVPDWVRTRRAEDELAAMTEDERAAAPEPIPLPVLTDAVLALIEDDTRSGQAVVLG